MIRKNEDRKIVVMESTGNAVGKVTFKNIINKDEFCNSGSLFSEITIAPKSMVKYHEHHNEFEVYYIIKGEGIYNDNNETNTVVRAGDVTYCPSNYGHSFENTSDTEDLVFIALINKCFN